MHCSIAFFDPQSPCFGQIIRIHWVICPAAPPTNLPGPSFSGPFLSSHQLLRLPFNPAYTLVLLPFDPKVKTALLHHCAYLPCTPYPRLLQSSPSSEGLLISHSPQTQASHVCGSAYRLLLLPPVCRNFRQSSTQSPLASITNLHPCPACCKALPFP